MSSYQEVFTMTTSHACVSMLALSTSLIRTICMLHILLSTTFATASKLHYLGRFWFFDNVISVQVVSIIVLWNRIDVDVLPCAVTWVLIKLPV